MKTEYDKTELMQMTVAYARESNKVDALKHILREISEAVINQTGRPTNLEIRIQSAAAIAIAEGK